MPKTTAAAARRAGDSARRTRRKHRRRVYLAALGMLIGWLTIGLTWTLLLIAAVVAVRYERDRRRRAALARSADLRAFGAAVHPCSAGRNPTTLRGGSRRSSSGPNPVRRR